MTSKPKHRCLPVRMSEKRSETRSPHITHLVETATQPGPELDLDHTMADSPTENETAAEASSPSEDSDSESDEDDFSFLDRESSFGHLPWRYDDDDPEERRFRIQLVAASRSERLHLEPYKLYRKLATIAERSMFFFIWKIWNRTHVVTGTGPFHMRTELNSEPQKAWLLLAWVVNGWSIAEAFAKSQVHNSAAWKDLLKGQKLLVLYHPAAFERPEPRGYYPEDITEHNYFPCSGPYFGTRYNVLSATDKMQFEQTFRSHKRRLALEMETPERAGVLWEVVKEERERILGESDRPQPEAHVDGQVASDADLSL
ncbi:hypothetical protein BJ508DRAFT_308688 [Ascobolus immersus RN42]|uniref:Uncharacterized protein n=1 Tax=Ascobolus immersus RN42 TaxID=1160509 RepID=A0A3N4HYZ8_ASCIM|nr:hypothetical protein BJ508DRAFT_308688 [Ascobolus immersus RN42]